MSWPLSREAIAEAFIGACRLEVRTLKPGNVHVFAEGHRMTVADFDKSAEVSAPFIADPSLPVGTRIRRAVEATFAAVGTNTNLGILLLCAPLAAAADRSAYAGAHPHSQVRAFGRRLMVVLESLDHADAEEVYRAIARASPAGLGEGTAGDVHEAPPADWTLLDAMKAAADRDMIAYEYATDFGVIAAQMEIYRRQQASGLAPEWALAERYLAMLAARPDTHIVRKHGIEAAEWVVLQAREAMSEIGRSANQDLGQPRNRDILMNLDAQLKTKGFNPGSLADLSVAIACLSNLFTAAGVPLRS